MIILVTKMYLRHRFTVESMNSMRKFLVPLAMILFFTGCSAPGPDAKKVDDFCEYVVKLLRENNRQEFLKLYMTEQESLMFLQAVAMDEQQREKNLQEFFASVRQGDYNLNTRAIWFDNLRKDVGEEFLKNCYIKSNLKTRVQERDDFKLASPVVILESEKRREKLLVGNLVFFDGRWRILKGPWWMD